MKIVKLPNNQSCNCQTISHANIHYEFIHCTIILRLRWQAHQTANSVDLSNHPHLQLSKPQQLLVHQIHPNPLILLVTSEDNSAESRVSETTSLPTRDSVDWRLSILGRTKTNFGQGQSSLFLRINPEPLVATTKCDQHELLSLRVSSCRASRLHKL